jgi:hypothetical protein
MACHIDAVSPLIRQSHSPPVSAMTLASSN